jgi:hypothetical protein
LFVLSREHRADRRGKRPQPLLGERDDNKIMLDSSNARKCCRGARRERHCLIVAMPASVRRNPSEIANAAIVFSTHQQQEDVGRISGETEKRASENCLVLKRAAHAYPHIVCLFLLLFFASLLVYLHYLSSVEETSI